MSDKDKENEEKYALDQNSSKVPQPGAAIFAGPELPKDDATVLANEAPADDKESDDDKSDDDEKSEEKPAAKKAAAKKAAASDK